MRPALKIFVVFLIIMVTFGLPIILQQVINPDKPEVVQGTPTPVETEKVDDIRFISVPPVLVSANSSFMYKIIVTSLSGNDVTISILAKPDWMLWEPESQQLLGLVPETGGVFTVTLRAATIAGDVQDQTFTVTIDNPQEVKGAKTIGMWKDPFHPNVFSEPETDLPLLPEVTADSIPEELDSEVLGEKTTATATKVLNTNQQKYLLYVLTAILLVVIVSIIIRIAKILADTRSKLPAGVVIERGRK